MPIKHRSYNGQQHCDHLLPRSDNTSMGVGTIELSSYANAIEIQTPFIIIVLVENLHNGSYTNLASTAFVNRLYVTST